MGLYRRTSYLGWGQVPDLGPWLGRLEAFPFTNAACCGAFSSALSSARFGSRNPHTPKPSATSLDSTFQAP